MFLTIMWHFRGSETFTKQILCRVKMRRDEGRGTVKPLTSRWRTFVRTHCLIRGNAAMCSHSNREKSVCHCVCVWWAECQDRGWRQQKGDLGVIKLKAADTINRSQRHRQMKTTCLFSLWLIELSKNTYILKKKNTLLYRLFLFWSLFG